MKKIFATVFSILLIGSMIAGSFLPAAFAANVDDGASTDKNLSEEDASSTEHSNPIEVLDTDKIEVLITGSETNDEGDYIWNIRITNKNSSKMFVTMDRFVLNGIFCESPFGIEVPGDKTLDTNTCWSASTLDAAGIAAPDSISNASFRIEAYNNENWEEPAYVEESISISLDDHEGAALNDFTPDESDIVVFDNDVAAMAITDFIPSPDTNEYIVKVSLVNKTDAAISVEMPDGYIGEEHMTSGYMKQFVPAHAATIGTWSWGYEWMFYNGYYGSDGLIRTDLPMTLNINIYNEDDVTADPQSLTNLFVAR